MKQLDEMLKRTTRSPYYERMLRFAAPLNDLFGVNHFWYNRITYSGHFYCISSHAAFSEYCLDNALVSYFPSIRHPDNVPEGIHLMKSGGDDNYRTLLKDAWDKFQINFNLNLIKKIPEGLISFGFATHFHDPFADQRLLNKLPLLNQFIKVFFEKHKKLIHLLKENQIDLPAMFGPVYYKRQEEPVIMSKNYDKFLRAIGLESILRLTPRELDIMKYLANGYPAPYIAETLKLNTRTVENYIATIKSKLFCDSKVELIQKAIEIASIDIYTETHSKSGF